MIKVKVIADSVNEFNGKRLTTFEIEYPRIILSEFNTHRMLSKNSSSSRAIPENAMLDHLSANYFSPSAWAENRAGMTAGVRLSNEDSEKATQVWKNALDEVIVAVKMLYELKVHKQWANRLLEPFQIMKTVVSGTEWENMFYLRNHPDAQPEFQLLAEKMEEAYDISTPVTLREGDWHLPYYGSGYWINGESKDLLEDAIKISVSCCAQTSYRKQDDTLEKANVVFDRLNIGSSTDPAHASPLEHCGTPITMNKADYFVDPEDWQEGVTALHRQLGWMSGNLAGWVQYRQLINNHTKW